MRECLRQAVAHPFLSCPAPNFRCYSAFASSERRILPESRLSCLRSRACPYALQSPDLPSGRSVITLLDCVNQAALDETVGIENRRLQQVQTYLRLAREGKSVVASTRELGLHSRSYVHRQIQRQALELVTEAFLQLARLAQLPDDHLSSKWEVSLREMPARRIVAPHTQPLCGYVAEATLVGGMGVHAKSR